MTYSLHFVPSALKEWHKLGETIRTEFKKKLKERLQNPKVPKDQLRSYTDIYKIKLRSAGYRLIYQVKNAELIVLVLVVGKRDKDFVYKEMDRRLTKKQ